MGRVTWVCSTCSEHFTRKYSAKRHNLTIHSNGGGEIVPLLEYLVGRKSGRYQASNPSWYRHSGKETRIHNFGHATTVADSMGNTFRPDGLQRQQQGQYQCQQQEQNRWQQQKPLSNSIRPASPYLTDRRFQSDFMNTTDDEEKTALSQETRLKIAELKRLIYKYPQYHRNPGAIISCVIYFCSEGDNSFLDDKLEQLRSVDAISKY